MNTWASVACAFRWNRSNREVERWAGRNQRISIAMVVEVVGNFVVINRRTCHVACGIRGRQCDRSWIAYVQASIALSPYSDNSVTSVWIEVICRNAVVINTCRFNVFVDRSRAQSGAAPVRHAVWIDNSSWNWKRQ